MAQALTNALVAELEREEEWAKFTNDPTHATEAGVVFKDYAEEVVAAAERLLDVGRQMRQSGASS